MFHREAVCSLCLPLCNCREDTFFYLYIVSSCRSYCHQPTLRTIRLHRVRHFKQITACIRRHKGVKGPVPPPLRRMSNMVLSRYFLPRERRDMVYVTSIFLCRLYTLMLQIILSPPSSFCFFFYVILAVIFRILRLFRILPLLLFLLLPLLLSLCGGHRFISVCGHCSFLLCYYLVQG